MGVSGQCPMVLNTIFRVSQYSRILFGKEIYVNYICGKCCLFDYIAAYFIWSKLTRCVLGSWGNIHDILF